MQVVGAAARAQAQAEEAKQPILDVRGDNVDACLSFEPYSQMKEAVHKMLATQIGRSEVSDSKDLRDLLDAGRVLQVEKERKMKEILHVKDAHHRKELEDLLSLFVDEVQRIGASRWCNDVESLHRSQKGEGGPSGAAANDLEKMASEAASAIHSVAGANRRVASNVGVQIHDAVSSQSRGVVADIKGKGKSVEDSSDLAIPRVGETRGFSTPPSTETGGGGGDVFQDMLLDGPAPGLLVPITDCMQSGGAGAGGVVGEDLTPALEVKSEVPDSGDDDSVDYIRKRAKRLMKCTTLRNRKQQITIPTLFGVSGLAGWQVSTDFHEDVMYCCGPELSMAWFRRQVPWNLEMTGLKIKYLFGRGGEMNYNSIDAAMRVFMEKEVVMMLGVSNPHWRHLAPPDLSEYLYLFALITCIAWSLSV